MGAKSGSALGNGAYVVSILTAKGLSKHFGAQDIFEGVSLQIAHGERTALVGPNGVGKTTLLRILAGLELASDGQLHRAKGLRVGYLAQEVTLADGGETLWELARDAFAHLQRQAAELHRLEELKERDPERFEQKKKEQSLEYRSFQLAEKFRESKDEKEKAKIKNDLSVILGELFDLREKDREEEIKHLNKKLEHLKSVLAERKKKKKEIVERRLQELIGERDVLIW